MPIIRQGVGPDLPIHLLPNQVLPVHPKGSGVVFHLAGKNSTLRSPPQNETIEGQHVTLDTTITPFMVFSTKIRDL